MALATYRKKRNFETTSEPRGKRPKAKGGNSYLIQKHAARRLHYDLRLELDGVLKSWAVTRGPSLVAGDKRLAVQVEDHPLEYGGFEGTIPKGEYGGGTVLLWDRGSWNPIGDPHHGLEKGHLEFELHGDKLAGRWHLVRLAGKPREKRLNWLLIKADDEAARPAGGADVLVDQPASVSSGRAIEDIAGEAPGWSSKDGKIEHAPAAASQPAAADINPAKLKGAKEGLPAGLRRAHAGNAGAQGTSREALAARDQVRWLPDPGRGSMPARSSCEPAAASTGPAGSARIW